MRDPRLRASPRHGGAVRCLANIRTDTDPPRGRPFGGGGVHRNSEEYQHSGIMYYYVKL